MAVVGLFVPPRPGVEAYGTFEIVATFSWFPTALVIEIEYRSIPEANLVLVLAHDYCYHVN